MEKSVEAIFIDNHEINGDFSQFHDPSIYAIFQQASNFCKRQYGPD